MVGGETKSDPAEAEKEMAERNNAAWNGTIGLLLSRDMSSDDRAPAEWDDVKLAESRVETGQALASPQLEIRT